MLQFEESVNRATSIKDYYSLGETKNIRTKCDSVTSIGRRDVIEQGWSVLTSWQTVTNQGWTVTKGRSVIIPYSNCQDIQDRYCPYTPQLPCSSQIVKKTMNFSKYLKTKQEVTMLSISLSQTYSARSSASPQRLVYLTMKLSSLN